MVGGRGGVSSSVNGNTFQWWLPRVHPPAVNRAACKPAHGLSLCGQAPKFYAPTPPAPAGLQWWSYAAGVPPLPEPGSVLGSNYSDYAWRYDNSYSAQSYSFSQLDHVRP